LGLQPQALTAGAFGDVGVVFSGLPVAVAFYILKTSHVACRRHAKVVIEDDGIMCIHKNILNQKNNSGVKLGKE
jgi:hypothetical protein